MKIAVASTDTQVSGHFGHCDSFNIYETKDGIIQSKTVVANPGHKPGFLPNFLGDMGVKVIIAGSMGGGAAEIFNRRNIEVIVGVKGSAREAAENYLKGNLQSTGSVCHSHEHADKCGEQL